MLVIVGRRTDSAVTCAPSRSRTLILSAVPCGGFLKYCDTGWYFPTPSFASFNLPNIVIVIINTMSGLRSPRKSWDLQLQGRIYLSSSVSGMIDAMHERRGRAVCFTSVLFVFYFLFKGDHVSGTFRMTVCSLSLTRPCSGEPECLDDQHRSYAYQSMIPYREATTSWIC